MKRIAILTVVLLAVGACTSQQTQRGAGGALIGGATGAAIGALAGGGRGAAIGAGVGAATGAAVGVATTPQDECYVRDSSGALVRVPCP